MQPNYIASFVMFLPTIRTNLSLAISFPYSVYLYCILETETPPNITVHTWAFLPKAAGAPILRPFVTQNLFRKKKLFFVPLPPSHVSRLLSIRLLFRDARKRASINPDRTSTSSRGPSFLLNPNIASRNWKVGLGLGHVVTRMICVPCLLFFLRDRHILHFSCRFDEEGSRSISCLHVFWRSRCIGERS